MLARFDKSVIAEKPDLVLWQVGTNSVLRDRPIDARATVLHEGSTRLKAIGRRRGPDRSAVRAEGE